MQIEAGKYYRTRDGRKVGPIRPWEGVLHEWAVGDGSNLEGFDSGDLIAEWTDGPVRTETVTKRRIVPGVYGRLKVTEGATRSRVGVGIVGPSLDDGVTVWSLNAEELDSIAMVASQLAEALRHA